METVQLTSLLGDLYSKTEDPVLKQEIEKVIKELEDSSGKTESLSTPVVRKLVDMLSRVMLGYARHDSIKSLIDLLH